jgi:hypothetical protein
MKSLKESILSDVETTLKAGDDLVNAKLLFDTLASLTKKNYGDYKNYKEYIGNNTAIILRKKRFADTDLLGKSIKKGDLVLVLRDLPIHENTCDHAYGIVTDIKNGEYKVLCGICPFKYEGIEIQKHYDDLSLTMDMVKDAALGGTYKGWELIRIVGKNQFEAALNKIKM